MNSFALAPAMGAATPPLGLFDRLMNCDLNGLEREDLSPFLPLVMRLAAERTHDLKCAPLSYISPFIARF